MKKSKSHLLLIDDDEKFCRLTQKYLESMGYSVTVIYNGFDGLHEALTGSFQAVILDVMMPNMDGFEVLRQLRTQSKIPVLMLTARGEEPDRIVGLEMGADDYLPKTFSPREILARIRALLRRAEIDLSIENDTKNKVIMFDNIIIDGKNRVVFRGDNRVNLTSLEFDLLFLLAENVGKVMSRDDILDQIAGREYSVFDRAIDVHVSAVRRKIGDNPRQPRFIKTIRSVGYMFAFQGQGK